MQAAQAGVGVRRPAPCRRLDPITGETIEVIKGRAFEPDPVKFARRVEQADLPRGADTRVLDSVSIETLEQLSDLHRLADGMSLRKA